MAKFTVYAQLVRHLETVIEADTMAEAQRIAEYDLITDDFEGTESEFILGEVIARDISDN